jgi:hypothetical protein
MINGCQNIESWFLEQHIDKFPGNLDYIANYRTIKAFMNSEVHPEIKAMVMTFIPEMYLNDHGEKHIKKVIDKASEIIDISENVLSPYEVFFLLVAIQIHDAGHLINGRKDHAKNAQKIINTFDKKLITPFERKFVLEIAKAHSGKKDPIGNLKDKQIITSERINLKLIAAILRLADELADDATRASSFLLENEQISDKSLLFHEFSARLDSCVAEMESHQIKMNFYLLEEHLSKIYLNGSNQVFLLDEIYERTIKTYLECQYCNRYLPEKYRYTTVNVDIEIETENELIIPKSISYRLKEKGYPDLGNNNIFEICDKELMNENKRLDGRYYNDIIQSGMNHEKSI